MDALSRVLAEISWFAFPSALFLVPAEGNGAAPQPGWKTALSGIILPFPYVFRQMLGWVEPGFLAQASFLG